MNYSNLFFFHDQINLTAAIEKNGELSKYFTAVNLFFFVSFLADANLILHLKKIIEKYSLKLSN